MQGTGLTRFAPVKPQHWVVASFEHHTSPQGSAARWRTCGEGRISGTRWPHVHHLQPRTRRGSHLAGRLPPAPAPLLLREAYAGTSAEAIADKYQVSQHMARFRLNTSGVLLQARRARRN